MNKLKEIRKQNNLTCAQMAEKLNLSSTYYWQIENNKRNLSYLTAFKISKIFSLKPDDLFYEEFKKKNNQLKKADV